MEEIWWFEIIFKMRYIFRFFYIQRKLVWAELFFDELNSVLVVLKRIYRFPRKEKWLVESSANEIDFDLI